MAANIFLKPSLQKALPIINDITSPKFPLLLDRIARKLEENAFKTKPFSNEEEEKLVVSLNIDKESLLAVLELSVYIFEQAAFHMKKPSLLSRQLQSANMVAEKADLYAQTWGSHAKMIVERLRKNSINPTELQDVSWSLNLQMSSKFREKQKSPLGMLVFHLQNNNNGPSKVYTQFNHEELYQFYKKIDLIQTQLDALK